MIKGWSTCHEDRKWLVQPGEGMAAVESKSRQPVSTRRSLRTELFERLRKIGSLP